MNRLKEIKDLVGELEITDEKKDKLMELVEEYGEAEYQEGQDCAEFECSNCEDSQDQINDLENEIEELTEKYENGIRPANLYDEMKEKILKTLFEKCSLEQLEEIEKQLKG
jgi:hypothetical protein